VGEKRNAYKVLVRKPEGKRPFGRTSRRWEYNIEMDLEDIGWESVDYINLAQNSDGGLL
jgi:hypothetical protein